MPRLLFRSAAAPLLLSLLVFAGCDDDAPTTPSGVQPVIVALSPAAPEPSDSPQTLTFSGSGFGAGLRVVVTAPDGSSFEVQGAAIGVVQSTAFDASVLLKQTGIYSFVVHNVNGVESPVFTTVVQPPGSMRPIIYSATPASAARSTTPTVVTLQGASFGVDPSVMVTDPNGLAMAITAAALSVRTDGRLEFSLTFGVRGTYTMVVVTTAGETSNPVFVSVQ